MSKLLSANFMRLKKDKFFWYGMIFMFAAGIFFPVMRYTDMRQTGCVNNLDNGFFGCALFISIIMPVFCSLFIGTEHSDGTIRNKIIIGQKRTFIYFANIIISSFVGIMMCLTFFVPYIIIGIPLLGFFTADIKIIFITGLTVLFLSVAFASIFTLIAMICRNKAIAAVTCILLAIVLLLAGAMLNRMLEAPKTIPTYTLDENNEPIVSEESNPKYLEGIKRDIIQTVYDIIPGGQVIQCVSLEIVNISRLPLYSLAIIILTTSIGLISFKKTDLK